jgi:hypothetical protein
MTRSRIVCALAAALALAAVPAAAQAAVPDAAQQWEMRGVAGVRNASPSALFNTKNGGRLGYDNRVFGVDLGWVSDGGDFEFRRDTGSANVRDHRPIPITETENVAIYNTKTRRYLKYYKRGESKAELEWSRTPVHEWQVRRQSGGSSVRFALFNDRVDRYLVHQVKNYGINLGWLSEGPPPVMSASVALSAQPVVQGWIPFLGWFGGGTAGTLRSVQNASQSATLLFVKPGRSTTQCSDPTATVPVAPRASMTADQLKTLYGSATPRLPVTFLACVATTTPQSTSLTYLNLTYTIP